MALELGHRFGFTETARDDHFCLWPDLAQLREDFLAAHVRHAQIEDHQSDVGGMPLEKIDSRRTAVGRQNRIAIPFERFLRHVPDELLIVHHQDDAGALQSGAGRFLGELTSRHASGEQHRKAAALSRRTAYDDGAFVSPDNSRDAVLARTLKNPPKPFTPKAKKKPSPA